MLNYITFTTNGDTLIIRGKTVYIKEYIKSIGATWNSSWKSWTLPISSDSEIFRTYLNTMTNDVIHIEKEAKKLYNSSPEYYATNEIYRKEFNRTCLEQKKLTGAFYWICCEDMAMIDYSKHGQHTVCNNHGLCINGKTYTEL